MALIMRNLGPITATSVIIRCNRTRPGQAGIVPPLLLFRALSCNSRLPELWKISHLGSSHGTHMPGSRVQMEHEAGIGPAWAAFKAQLGCQQPTRVLDQAAGIGPAWAAFRAQLGCQQPTPE